MKVNLFAFLLSLLSFVDGSGNGNGSGYFPLPHSTLKSSISILPITPFLFDEPYFHNWMSFLFITAFFCRLLFAPCLFSLSLLSIFLHFEYELVPKNSPMISLFLHFSRCDDSYSGCQHHSVCIASLCAHFSRFCSMTFEHMHVFEAENIQNDPYLVFCVK